MSGLIEGQKVGVGIKIDTSDTPAEDDTLVWREASKAFVPEPLGSASVAADSITNVKLANMATSTVKARVTAGTGDPEDITVAQLRTLIGITAAGLALIDDATAAAQLTTLGVSAFVQTILNDADAAAVRATIGMAVQAAYTQTYSTASRTVPNATYAAPAVTAATVATSNAADQSAIYVEADVDTIATLANANKVAVNAVIADNLVQNTALAALAADVIALKQVITSLIDDSQAVGLST